MSLILMGEIVCCSKTQQHGKKKRVVDQAKCLGNWQMLQRSGLSLFELAPHPDHECIKLPNWQYGCWLKPLCYKQYGLKVNSLWITWLYSAGLCLVLVDLSEVKWKPFVHIHICIIYRVEANQTKNKPVCKVIQSRSCIRFRQCYCLHYRI